MDVLLVDELREAPRFATSVCHVSSKVLRRRFGVTLRMYEHEDAQADSDRPVGDMRSPLCALCLESSSGRVDSMEGTDRDISSYSRYVFRFRLSFHFGPTPFADLVLHVDRSSDQARAK